MKTLTSLFALLIALPMLATAMPEIGKIAPEFTATTTAGEAFTLSDHKESIVVLEWTNHECPFVKKYYDNGDMQKLQSTYTAKGVKWVRINSSAPEKQGHVSAEESNKIALDQKAAATATILDVTGGIGRLYAAKTTPHMFVIGKNGILAYAGAIDSIASANTDDIAKADAYVANAIDALMAGKAVEPATTKAYGCSVKY